MKGQQEAQRKKRLALNALGPMAHSYYSHDFSNVLSNGLSNVGRLPNGFPTVMTNGLSSHMKSGNGQDEQIIVSEDIDNDEYEMEDEIDVEDDLPTASNQHFSSVSMLHQNTESHFDNQIDHHTGNDHQTGSGKRTGNNSQENSQHDVNSLGSLSPNAGFPGNLKKAWNDKFEVEEQQRTSPNRSPILTIDSD
jgi:hypothetical protein